MTPTGVAPREVYGWKAIAAALGVSIRRAQELATRPHQPIPVRRSHRGIRALVSRLQDWVDAEDMDYRVSLEAKRTGTEG